MAGNIAAEPSSDPSETYRVSRITPMNTGVASRTATGWMTSIVPTPVPTPRPLRNPEKTDQIAPATAAAPHSTSTSGIAGDEPREQHRQRALQQVARDHDRGPPGSERSQGIGPAGPPGADRPRVRAARPPRDEHPDRDRSREVGDEHQDDGPEHDRGVQQARSNDDRGPADAGSPEGRSLASAARGPSVARLGTPRVPSVAMTHQPSRPSTPASWRFEAP